MRKLWTLLLTFGGLMNATPSQAELCDMVFINSSCPVVGCQAASACIADVKRSWTRDRCMSRPAQAQGEIAAACEQCNNICASPTAWMQGSWSGTGSQDRPPSSWSMRLTVSGNSFSIAYPSLNCGGYSSLQNTGSGVASFVETITYGNDKCANGGAVTVGSLGAGWMQFRWSSPEATASATLSRN
jgi:hypothetical protein